MRRALGHKLATLRRRLNAALALVVGLGYLCTDPDEVAEAGLGIRNDIVDFAARKRTHPEMLRRFGE